MDGNKFYAGVGSRETPADVLKVMTRFARHMESRGYVLRSGGADGADSAFEEGASVWLSQIFLPWPGFNGRKSNLDRPSPSAVKLGMRYHPMLAALPEDWETSEKYSDEKRKKIRTIAKLMGRNCHQVLGPSLDSKSAFTICWTPDGADGTTILTSDKTGGTGQAIRIAADHGIKVYNLQRPEVMEHVLNKISATA